MTADIHLAGTSREALVRNPRRGLAAFPVFPALVALADCMAADAHGQIVFVTPSH